MPRAIGAFALFITPDPFLNVQKSGSAKALKRGLWQRLLQFLTQPNPLDPDHDPDFAASLIALVAKLGRADGVVSAQEIAAFERALKADGGARHDARRLFALAQQSVAGFEGYARGIARRYRAQPAVLEDVLDMLFYIAKADGLVTPDELSFLQTVADIFGFSAFEFRRLASSHLGPDPMDPYVTLGIEADATLEEVRKAWLRALAANHPDRAMGRGFSGVFVQMSNDKAASINAAYQAILRAHSAAHVFAQ